MGPACTVSPLLRHRLEAARAEWAARCCCRSWMGSTAVSWRRDFARSSPEGGFAAGIRPTASRSRPRLRASSKAPPGLPDSSAALARARQPAGARRANADGAARARSAEPHCATPRARGAAGLVAAAPTRAGKPLRARRRGSSAARPDRVASRGRGDQLPPLLRRQRPGRDPPRRLPDVFDCDPPPASFALIGTGEVDRPARRPPPTASGTRRLLELLRARPRCPATCTSSIEKILAQGRGAAGRWPVAGTTGYEFLNALWPLRRPRRPPPVDRLYAASSASDAVRTTPAIPLEAADHDDRAGRRASTCWRSAAGISERNRRLPRLHALRAARRCREVAAFSRLPHLRRRARRSGRPDRAYIEGAVAAARAQRRLDPRSSTSCATRCSARSPTATPAARGRRRFRDALPADHRPRSWPRASRTPRFYVYNRLVSLNEVGGDPGRFGASPADVPRASNADAPARWPHALLATVDPRHQAQRGRPRPASTCSPSCPTSGARAVGAGAR